MKKPDVSIIIPCFNDGLYLQECIDSVLSYSGSLQLEIIIVNDGSTDEYTLDILHQFEQKTTITVIHQENKKMSAARNVGIQNTKADFFIPLDSDDILNTDFVDKAYYEIINNNTVGVVYGNYRCFGKVNKEVETKYDNYSQFYVNGIVITSLVRKQAWLDCNGFDENMLNGYEDWEFWLNVQKNGWIFEKINIVALNYRIKENSTNTNAIQKHSEIIHYIHTKHYDMLMQQYIELNRKLHDAKNNRRLLLKHLIRNIFGKVNE